MKKVYIFCLAVCLLFLPASVKAYGMKNFYMNATVLNNGDMEIEEFFTMTGDYRGFERIIEYQNTSLPSFSDDVASFGGSSIYNASGIMVKEVKGIPLNKVSIDEKNLATTFEGLGKVGDTFVEDAEASAGDYGKFILTTTSDGGYRIKMFNPEANVGFYIKYVVKDVAVLHNDVAEIGWNIFSDAMNESIGSFKMLIGIPGNANELRAFAHGPLTGNIDLLDKNHILLSVEGLNANTAMDTRFVFDKSVIPNGTKFSQVEGLNKILEYEGKKADEANAERDRAKAVLEKEKTMGTIFLGLEITWLIGLGLVLFFVYNKFDKEYTPMFKGKYFRDFPSELLPEQVGYLMNKKVSNNDLSADIMLLIYKKAISFEPVLKDKKDYKLTLNQKDTSTLSTTEQRVLELLFDGEETETTLKQFKKKAKSSYSSFLKKYEAWRVEANSVAEAEEFFENKMGSRLLAVLYTFAGIFLVIFTISYAKSILLSVAFILVGVISLFYLFSFYKRTNKGNEEYSKWKGLKNFITDFGNFKERELPQIALWEKYLVYAVSFGCAEKLAKDMQIKVAEYHLDTAGSPYLSTPDYFTSYLLFHHMMHQTVYTSHSSAISARDVANSSYSSGGGFGGGFSSGGGGFGGGGGGGRF